MWAYTLQSWLLRPLTDAGDSMLSSMEDSGARPSRASPQMRAPLSAPLPASPAEARAAPALSEPSSEAAARSTSIASPAAFGAGPGLALWADRVIAECSGVFVYIVTTAEDAAYSAASLALAPAAPGRFRRVGQSFGKWEVLWIADDWSGLEPEVWLRSGSDVCRATLSGNPARARAAAKDAARAARKRPVRKRRRRR